jgi:hypothetical protein
MADSPPAAATIAAAITTACLNPVAIMLDDHGWGAFDVELNSL